MNKLEKILKKNMNTIQLLGIITALVTLIFTCDNTRQTKKSIELSYKQYEELVSPIWLISVLNETNDIDDEMIKIVSNNASIVLNSVSVFYTINEKIDSLVILKPENWNTTYFKNQIISDIRNLYLGNQFLYSFSSCVPICISFSYYQHGTAKKIMAFYKLNIRAYLENRTTKLSFKSFEFLRYFKDFTKTQITNEMEEFNYNFGYKNCCKEKFINKKKREIIEQDKYLNEILSYSDIFQTFMNLTVIVSEDTTSKIQIMYPEFIVKKSLLAEIKTKQEDIVSKKKHYPKTVYQGFMNLKNFLDTVVYPSKNDFNLIIKTKWHKERKEVLKKYNAALIDSLFSTVRIE